MGSKLETLILSGWVFQCLGAAIAKLPPPNMTFQLLGTIVLLTNTPISSSATNVCKCVHEIFWIQLKPK